MQWHERYAEPPARDKISTKLSGRTIDGEKCGGAITREVPLVRCAGELDRGGVLSVERRIDEENAKPAQVVP